MQIGVSNDMKMAWRIFCRDLHRLSRNLIAMIVLGGICVIPSLYAWFNIYANMDPYANTGNIQVAVVNLDEGTENERIGHLNAGASVEEKLRDNEQLGWVFTDESSAVEGVKAGDYYAAIVIPETFSADLASVFSTEIHQPEIIYYSNEKKNAVAPKITGSGVTSLQQGINDEFVASVSETMTSILQDTFGEIDGDLDRSMKELKESIRDVSDLTGELQSLLEDFHALKADGDRMAEDGKEGIALAEELIEKSEDSLQSLEGNIADGRERLNDYSDKLHTEIIDANQKLSNLNASAGADLGVLNSQIRELDEALNRKTEPVVSKVERIQALNQDILETLAALNDTYPDNETIRTMLNDLKADNARHQKILLLLRSASSGAKDLYAFSVNTYSALSKGITSAQAKLSSSLTQLDTTVQTNGGAALDRAAAASGRL